MSEKNQKDDNVLKRTWQIVKGKVDDFVLDTKIESEFRTKNTSYTLYTKDHSISLCGYIIDKEIIVYGTHKVPKQNVIIDNETKKAYYVIDTKETTVKTVLNGIEYVRKGTCLVIDDSVEEVEVLKAGKRYFLCNK